ncbi:hypothetical protein GCM10025751_26460 [Haladaptatus pallidirubidus]|uniref:Uncharacterized protein n=1 Tax=Haladaptatus pallidirubidus TaxID=1008152 RepID=A0AAV3UI74_9EURY
MSVSRSFHVNLGKEGALWERNVLFIQTIYKKIYTMVKMSGIGFGILLILATLFGGDVDDDLRN